MELSIIIVNYRNKNKLETCLHSILKAEQPSFDYEIILVENNSGEDLNSLIKMSGNISLLNSQKNLGMGGGNNLGIERAQGDYILVLNPDTVIKDGAILTLLNYLKANPDVGIVGPKLLNPDGSLQYSCSRFPSFFMPILRRTFLGDYFSESRDSFQMMDFSHDVIKEVDWLMGSALMFKKSIILSTGEIWEPRFDERYFMYFEDTDICRSAQAKNLKVVYNPEAILIHDHARESAKHPWYIAIFLNLLIWRHIGSWIKYFLKWGIKF
jgi:hypothetical protein